MAKWRKSHASVPYATMIYYWDVYPIRNFVCDQCKQPFQRKTGQTDGKEQMKITTHQLDTLRRIALSPGGVVERKDVNKRTAESLLMRGLIRTAAGWPDERLALAKDGAAVVAANG